MRLRFHITATHKRDKKAAEMLQSALNMRGSARALYQWAQNNASPKLFLRPLYIAMIMEEQEKMMDEHDKGKLYAVEIDLDVVEKEFNELSHCSDISENITWESVAFGAFRFARALLSQLRVGATVKPVVGVDLEKGLDRLREISRILNDNEARALYNEFGRDLLDTIRKAQEGKGWIVVRAWPVKLGSKGGSDENWLLWNPAIQDAYLRTDVGGFLFTKPEAAAKCAELNEEGFPSPDEIKEGLEEIQLKEKRKLEYCSPRSSSKDHPMSQESPPDQQGEWSIITLKNGQYKTRYLYWYSARKMCVDELSAVQRKAILTALNGGERSE